MSTLSPKTENEGPPKKDKMHNIGTSEAKKSEQRTVADGLRMSVTIPKWAREAMGVGAEDKIWVRAEANQSKTEFVATLHSNGRSFTIPKEQRQSLGLNAGDEAPIWVADYVDESSESSKTKPSQPEAKNEESSENEEVLLRFDPPVDAQYHIKDGDSTVCGESLAENEFIEISDPGDALNPCPRCYIKSPEKMSNVQIVKHLADKAGFDYSDTNPSYFSKDQLVSLLEYVIELEENKDNN